MRREMGLLLIAIGFLLVTASLLQSPGQGSSGYGGVILIGPIPIVFGSSPEVAMASVIAAAGLMLLALLLSRWR